MADCSELAQGINDLAEATANREDMQGNNGRVKYDAVIKHITSEFPELSRKDITESILEAQRAAASNRKQSVQKEFTKIKQSEALPEGRAREAVARLEKLHAEGAFDDPTPKQRKAVNETLKIVRNELAKLRRESTLKKEVSGLKKGELPSRTTAPERFMDDPKMKALKDERDALVNNSKRIKALDEQIAAYTAGNRTPASPATPRNVSPEVAAREEQVAKLKRKADLADQIEKLTTALETGVLPEVKARSVPADDAALRLEIQRDKLTQAIRQRREELKPKSFFRKTVIQPVNGAQTFVRAIQTAMDVSAVLRQGGTISMAHPIRALSEFGPMFKAFRSEVAAKRVQMEIEARPNATLYHKAGLELSDWGGGIGDREEVFASRIANKIPGVKGSERAYTTFLNKIRADSFDAMMDSLGRAPTKAEAEAAAKFINVSTGRGDVGKMAQTFRDLSTIFYAPRNLWSRFQYLGGGLKSIGDAATGFKIAPEEGVAMRKMIAKEYARTALGFGVAAGLAAAAGATIELDHRSSDFLKFKFGNTRVDMGAGLLQPLVFLSRVLSGATKNQNGKIVPIRGPHVPFGGQITGDVVDRFGRSKLAPIGGLVADLATGKQFSGQPITPASIAANMAPLGFQDVYSALKEQGLVGGAPLALLALMGAGVSTYEPRRNARQAPQAP